MLRLLFASVFSVLLISSSVMAAGQEAKLVSDTGNLLKGTVYKKSGIGREGVITIKTSWSLPANPPVFRFDFDVVHGLIENSLHSFIIGDIEEITFYPLEDNTQPVGIKLKNGQTNRITLSSDNKAILGPVKLRFDEVRVLTDAYGENIIPAAEVEKIVLSRPPAIQDEDIPMLVDGLLNAVKVGVRDDLMDEDIAVVLENIQKKMKARLDYEKKGRN